MYNLETGGNPMALELRQANDIAESLSMTEQLELLKRLSTIIPGSMRFCFTQNRIEPGLFDQSVSVITIDALGDIGESAAVAIPVILPLLQDQGAAVRLQAAITLGKIGPSAKWRFQSC
jgi:hypothetical protein